MDKYFSQPTMNLITGLSRGDQAVVEAALKTGALVNEAGLTGTTPLIYSVIKLDRSAVAGLLALGANPNTRQADGHNALTAAYELDTLDPALMEILINSGKCDLNVLMPDAEPLMYHLIGSGQLNLLKLALQKGANPSLHSGSDRLLIIEAALIGEYDAIQLLLDAGASPHSTDAAGRSLFALVGKGASQRIDPDGPINKARLRLLERLQNLMIN